VAVSSSKKNRQHRLLMNIDLTMKCPSQAEKLVRGIGRQELGLSRNSAAKTLAAYTQRRIQHRRNWQPARRCEFGSAQQLMQVRGLTWHDPKLGQRTVQGMWMTQQMTQQELADGAAKWACRTWVVAVMDIQDHRIMGVEHEGWPRVALNPLKIMGDHGGASHYLVDNGATMFMGEIVSHYFLKSRNGGCAL